MAHWLLKTEPATFSWHDQVKRGDKGEPWSGVRNHQAKLNLMRMKKGERAFFYHSGEGKEIVGIVEVIREHYPDPTAKSGEPSSAPWVAVDVKAIEAAEDAGAARRRQGRTAAQSHGIGRTIRACRCSR